MSMIVERPLVTAVASVPAKLVRTLVKNENRRAAILPVFSLSAPAGAKLRAPDGGAAEGVSTAACFRSGTEDLLQEISITGLHARPQFARLGIPPPPETGLLGARFS